MVVNKWHRVDGYLDYVDVMASMYVQVQICMPSS